MFRKKWFKTFVAVLALAAMLTENTYSVFAAADGIDYTPIESEEEYYEEYADDTVEVEAYSEEEVFEEAAEEEYVEEAAEESFVEESSVEEESIEEATVEEATEEETIEETAPEEETALEENIEAEVLEEDTLEAEVPEENIPEEKNIVDDSFEITGFDDVTLYIDTDQMNDKDSFTLYFEGSADMSYDYTLDRIMSKSEGGIYYFEGLNKEMFKLYVSDKSEGMNVEYSIREDENPQITLVSAEEPEIEKMLEASSGSIIGEGYDDLLISIDSTDLLDDYYYKLYITTDAEVAYDGAYVSDGVINNLSDNVSNIRLSNLDKKWFEIYVVGENHDTIYADYSVDSLENGAVHMTVYTSDEAEVEKSLHSISNGISGVGYDELAVSMEYIKKLVDAKGNEAVEEDTESEEADEEDVKLSYNVSVRTAAENVSINGSTVTDTITLDDSVEEIIVSGLEANHFELFFEAVADEKISDAKINAEVVDEENGQAKVAIEYSVEKEATKRVYEYEDSKVKVVATLERPDAIPDDAVMIVSPVYDTAKYLDVMNEESTDDSVEYTDDNTLFYDIAFYADNTRAEELEPEEGSVSVSIEFKKNQLEEEIDANAASEESIEVTHIIEDGNDIVLETVDAEVSVEDGTVEFVTESFSIWVITNVDRSSASVKIEFYNADGTSIDTNAKLADKRYLYIEDFKDVNKHYVAEIQPQNGVYGLNLSGIWVNGTNISSWSGKYNVYLLSYTGDEYKYYLPADTPKTVEGINVLNPSSDKLGKYTITEFPQDNYSLDNYVIKVKAPEAPEPAYSNSLTASDVLGNAANFVIVADTLTNGGDFEGNFATNLLNGGSSTKHCIGTTYAGDYVISSVSESAKWYPINNGNANIPYVYTTNAAYEKLAENTGDDLKNRLNKEYYLAYTDYDYLSSFVDSMLGDARSTASTYAGLKGVDYVDIVDNGVLDFTSYKDGAYVVNFSDGANAYGDNMSLNVKLNPNQSVIFNIPNFGTVKINDLTLNGKRDDGKNYTDKVVWNCYNASKVETRSSAGIVLCPNADMENCSVSSGWVVAKSFKNGPEWHNAIDKKPIKIPTSFHITASKTVNNEAPAANEKFSFKLSEYVNGWNEVKTVQNDGSFIDFGELNYNSEGTHYYKVEESVAGTGYRLDPAVTYIVKVVVGKTTAANGDITYKVTNSAIYKNADYNGSEIGFNDDVNKVSQITFNNAIGGENYDYELSVEKMFEGGNDNWPDGYTFGFNVSRFIPGNYSNLVDGPFVTDSSYGLPVNENGQEVNYVTVSKANPSAKIGTLHFELENNNGDVSIIMNGKKVDTYPGDNSTLEVDGTEFKKTKYASILYLITEDLSNKYPDVEYDVSQKTVRLFLDVYQNTQKNMQILIINGRVSQGMKFITDANGNSLSDYVVCDNLNGPQKFKPDPCGSLDEEKILFKNKKTEKGELEIVKSFVGISAPTSDADKAKINFTITGPNNYTKTVSYKDFTDGKYTLTDLLTGTYTVVENNTYNLDDYVCETTYSVANGTTEVVANTKSTVTVTNKYSNGKVKFHITGSKKIKSGNYEVNPNADQKFSFRLLQYTSSNIFKDISGERVTTTNTNGTFDFGVRELSIAPRGATSYYSADGILLGGSDGAKPEAVKACYYFAVVEEKPNNDEYTYDDAAFIIKVVYEKENGVWNEEPTTYDVYKCPNGNKYTADLTLPCKYGPQLDKDISGCTKVGDLSALKFVNEGRGKIYVHKQILRNGKYDPNYNKNEVFYFTVRKVDKNYDLNPDKWSTADADRANDTFGDLVINPATGGTVFSIKNGETVTIDNLPLGATYKITETNANGVAIASLDEGTYFAYTVEYSCHVGYVDAFEDGHKDITIYNTPKTGDVSLTKKDFTSKEVLSGVKFQIRNTASGNLVYVAGSNGSYAVDNTNGTGKSSDIFTGSDGKFTVSGLEWGTYKLEEAATKGNEYINDGFVAQFTVGNTGTKFDSATSSYDNTTALYEKTESNGSLALTVYNRRRPFEFEAFKYYLSDVNTSVKVPLSGVQFALKNATGTVVASGSTDDNGKVVFNNNGIGFEWGTYTWEETIPQGYVDNDGTNDGKKTGTFTVDGNSSAIKVQTGLGKVSVDVENTPVKGNVKLIKYKDNNENSRLAGVKFNLYRGEGTTASIVGLSQNAVGSYKYLSSINNAVTVLVTDNNGEIAVTDLPTGKYFFREVEAASGYTRITNDLAFEIVASGEASVSPIKVGNTQFRAAAEFVKVDASNTNTKLQGATFKLQVKNASGEYTDISGTYTSDANGKVRAEGLAIGEYRFVETASATGYKYTDANNNPIVATFAITEADAGKGYGNLPAVAANAGNPVTNEREKGRVSILKVNNNNTPLQGVVFELYKDGTKTDVTLTTGNDGKASAENLEWGNYYLVEKADTVPTGYEALTATWCQANLSFTINATTLSVTFDGTEGNRNKIVNQPILTKVKLTKKDKDNAAKVLNGVTFDLYKGSVGDKSNKINASPLTTSNGIIEVENLEFGAYYFEETASITGYQFDVNNHPTLAFTIDANHNGEVLLEMENEEALGSVTLTKVGPDGEKLDGAVFRLHANNSQGIARWWNNLTNGDVVGTYIMSASANNPDGSSYDASTHTLSVSGLKWGSYYFEEITAPTGYQITEASKKIEFIINDANNGANLTHELSATNTREKGSISLAKTGIKNGTTEKLNGAAFKLVKIEGENETVLDTVYTTAGSGDNAGKITVDNLDWGTYKFIEISAPEGYVAPPATAYSEWTAEEKAKWSTNTVTINAENFNETVGMPTVNVINDYIYGKLKLTKTQEELLSDNSTANLLIDGAEFIITQGSGNDEKGLVLTGSNGTYSFASLGSNKNAATTITTADAVLTVSGIPYGTYNIYETKAPEGYDKKDGSKTFVIDGVVEDEIDANLTFDNTFVQASLEFNKTDVSGGKLAADSYSAIRFTLYKLDAENNWAVNDTLTPDSNGKVTKSGLGLGSYKVVETTPAPGYEANTKEYTFSVTLENYKETIRLSNADDANNNVHNTPKQGIARILKVDQNGNVIDYTNLVKPQFSLFKKEPGLSADTPVITGLTPDDNGYVVYGPLDWGTYYFKETEGIKKTTGELVYSFDANKKYEFTIDATNARYDASAPENVDNIVTLTENAVNTLILGGAKIQKQDNDTKKWNEALVGTEFTVFDSSTNAAVKKDNANYVITVNNTGYAETALDIPVGSYYLQETKAANGYILSEEKYYFTIDKDNAETLISAATTNNVQIAYNTPEHGSAELYKYVSTGENATRGLEGAQFKLYKKTFDTNNNPVLNLISRIIGDKTVDTYTTNGSGMISVSDLEWGTYYFEETVAPAGYELPAEADRKTAEFTIGPNSLNYTGLMKLTKENTPQLGYIKLVKTGRDSAVDTNAVTGSAMAGAEFDLYKDGNKVGSYVTDNDGEIKATAIGALSWGTYYFVETKAPVGYNIPTNPQTESVVINSSNVSEHNAIATAITVDVENYKIFGNVKLVKTDDNNNALSGVKFVLKSGNNNITVTGSNGVYTYDETATATELVTGSDGSIIVKHLPIGEYNFVETEALAAYSAYTGDLKVTVSASMADGEVPAAGNTAYVTCINTTVYKTVQFIKTAYVVNENGRTGASVLSGAEFSLYKMAGTEVDVEKDTFINTYTSDSEGKVTATVGVGNYYFVESKAEGYKVDTTPLTFTITKDSPAVTTLDAITNLVTINDNGIAEMINYPEKGRVRLTKKYNKDGEATGTVAGATYSLYKVEGENDTYIGTGTTNSMGVIYFDNLEWGTYYFVEKDANNKNGAPSGYAQLDDAACRSMTTFTIDSSNADATVSVTSVDDIVLGSVEIDKLCDNTPVAGVVFKLYKESVAEGNLIASLTATGTDGKASYTGLSWDPATNGTKYILVETYTDALTGYKFDPENPTTREFIINATNLDQKFTSNSTDGAITNEKIKGKVELQKKDDVTKAAMADVEFELYSVANGLIDTYTTNSNGIINEKSIGKTTNTKMGELEVGEYYFKELKKAGYAVDESDSTYALMKHGNDTVSELHFIIKGNTATEKVSVEQVVSFTGENTIYDTPAKGKVSLTKEDKLTSVKLAGAVFELHSTTAADNANVLALIKSLFNNGDLTYGIYTTDNNGQITVENLPWGEYYFVETQAPSGYITDAETKYYFSVGEGTLSEGITVVINSNNNYIGSVGTITNERQLGKAELIKKDASSKAVLQGAEFKLYRLVEGADDVDVSARYGANENGVFITNTSGKITVENLEWDLTSGTTYYFVETKAPTGYEKLSLDECKENLAFTITAANVLNNNQVAVHTVTAENNIGYGYIALEKIFDGEQPKDASGNIDLSGVTFVLKNLADGENAPGTQYVTNSEGKITAEDFGPLLYGDYELVETGLPNSIAKNYPINNTPIRFNIPGDYEKDGVVKTTDTVNSKTVSVLNYSFTNSEVLAGAKLFKADENGYVDGIKFDVYEITDDGDVYKNSFESKTEGTESGLVEATGLPMGSYYFIEDADSATALGYVPSDAKYYFTITEADKNQYVKVYTDVNLTSELTGPVVNEKKKGAISLVKYKGETTQLVDLTGAEFELYQDNTLVEDITVMDHYNPETKAVTIEDLDQGHTYKFIETKAPNGFALSKYDSIKGRYYEESTEVTLSATAAFNEASLNRAVVRDDTINVKVSKVNVAGSDELPGAVMEILLGDDVLAHWTSTDTAREFTVGSKDDKDKSFVGFVPGEVYTLKEVSAPVGYTVAKPISFIVDANGNVTAYRTNANGDKETIRANGSTLYVEDTPIEAYISKKALDTNRDLNGATLVVKDAFGATVQTLETKGQDIKLDSTQIATSNSKEDAEKNNTYYELVETVVPGGYYTAKPIKFFVNNEGQIKIIEAADTASGVSADGKTLIMVDRPIHIEISKKLLSGAEGDYVNGAALTLYAKDEANEYKVIVDSWTTGKDGETAHVVNDANKKLVVGETYKLVEAKAPNGYHGLSGESGELAFITVYDSNNTKITIADGIPVQTETVYNDANHIVVSKYAINGNEEISGATLDIVSADTKQSVLTDKIVTNGKPAYITSLSIDKVSDEIKSKYNVYAGVSLEVSKQYSLVELSAPAGYALNNASVDFEIDANGTVKNSTSNRVAIYDEPLEIKLLKTDALDNPLSGASMQLLDSTGAVVKDVNGADIAFTSSNKPVLVTGRDVDEVEAANYARVFKAVLVNGAEYKLHEAAVPAGDYQLAEDVKFTIANSDVKASVRTVKMANYKGGDKYISGTKTWVIPANMTKPTVTIELYADINEKGKVVDKVDTRVLRNGEENYSFGPLKKYADTSDNHEITYEIRELPIKGFVSEEVKENGIVTGFINRIEQEYVDIEGSKVWVQYKDSYGKVDVNKRYANVEIYLLRDGKRVDADGDGKDDFVTVENGKLNKDGVGYFKFEHLDKYDLTTGREYVYSLEEPNGVDAYNYDITQKVDEYHFMVKNRPFDDPFSIKGVKTWIDPEGTKRPDVTIVLYRDGERYLETKLNANYEFEFSNLFEYRMGWSDVYRYHGADPYDTKELADGHKFNYEIREEGATGYNYNVEFDNNFKFQGEPKVVEAHITNTIIQEYVELSGTKTWNDQGISSKRPAIVFNLYASDSERTEVLVDTFVMPNTINTYTFGRPGQIQLPKYDAKGTEIKYTVKEVVPDGYVSTSEDNDFVNTPNKIIISKVDASNNRELAGASMKLVNVATKEVVDSWISTTEAHYVEALPFGATYEIVEDAAPRGYDLAAAIRFTVDASGVIAVDDYVEVNGERIPLITMKDAPIVGSVTLTKRDETTREPLSGATFNLYSANGNQVRVTGGNGKYVQNAAGFTFPMTVAEDGTLEITDLPYGSYYFREVSAPVGYEVSGATESFTIGVQGAKQTVTFADPRKTGSVSLLKTNPDYRPLAGATFELYSATPRTPGQAGVSTLFTNAYYRYGTYVTDQFGQLQVDGLPWDSYYFIETEAPAGYRVNLDVNGDPIVYTFTVDPVSASRAVISIGTIINDSEPGSSSSSSSSSSSTSFTTSTSYTTSTSFTTSTMTTTSTEITTSSSFVTTTAGSTLASSTLPARGVAGARVSPGGVLSGVLGVRAAPTSGVLGERVGPVTGDAANISLWIAILAASIAVIMVICLQDRDKKKNSKAKK